ncbi:MAG TPA: MgtC/SapB family protein, partial [Clostridiaceae bacterium]|nr:MgtC/SapB family protein [Clostridiaceae bacterium]
MNSTIQETGKVLLLLFISLICSGLIGADRERKNRPAGMRTHVIVCLASTLIMYAGIRLKNEYIDIAPNIDPARLAAQILSGIGFLGAGTILKGKDNVHGLTTAATLWSVACIGIVIGANYILAGICGTFMVWMTLRVLAHIEHKLLVNRRLSEVVVEFNA